MPSAEAPRAPRLVGVAGLGSVGGALAVALRRGEIAGLRLGAASASSPAAAKRRLADLGIGDVEACGSEQLPRHGGIVVEAAPAARFREIAAPAIEAGATLVVLSAGALLENWDLVDRARTRGAKIVVPSGAIGGLDAIQASAACAELSAVRLRTVKPLAALAAAAGAQAAAGAGGQPRLRLFHGSARDAVRAFPANANVSAALALAGLGPDRTEVEIWADRRIRHNRHRITVRSGAADIDITIRARPSAENPRTSDLARGAAVAALRRLSATLQVG